jgi:hypothetical protein
MQSRTGPVVAIALLALFCPTVFAQSQSASFRLQPTAVDAAGGSSSSVSSRGDGSFGQSLVVGTSSAPHFVVQSGFWGFVGSALVPVVLSASKIPAQPGDVDLTWSGNNTPFSLYRSANCASIFSSAFTATSNNFYVDSPAPSSGLTCYNVLAFAPGPQPPGVVAP